MDLAPSALMGPLLMLTAPDCYLVGVPDRAADNFSRADEWRPHLRVFGAHPGDVSIGQRHAPVIPATLGCPSR